MYPAILRANIGAAIIANWMFEMRPASGNFRASRSRPREPADDSISRSSGPMKGAEIIVGHHRWKGDQQSRRLRRKRH